MVCTRRQNQKKTTLPTPVVKRVRPTAVQVAPVDPRTYTNTVIQGLLSLQQEGLVGPLPPRTKKAQLRQQLDAEIRHKLDEHPVLRDLFRYSQEYPVVTFQVSGNMMSWKRAMKRKSSISDALHNEIFAINKLTGTVSYQILHNLTSAAPLRLDVPAARVSTKFAHHLMQHLEPIWQYAPRYEPGTSMRIRLWHLASEPAYLEAYLV